MIKGVLPECRAGLSALPPLVSASIETRKTLGVAGRKSARRLWLRRALKRGGQPGALVDGAFGVELGGHIGATNHVATHTLGFKRVGKAAF